MTELLKELAREPPALLLEVPTVSLPIADKRQHCFTRIVIYFAYNLRGRNLTTGNPEALRQTISVMPSVLDTSQVDELKAFTHTIRIFLNSLLDRERSQKTVIRNVFVVLSGFSFKTPCSIERRCEINPALTQYL